MFSRWPIIMSFALFFMILGTALLHVSTPRGLATFRTLPILNEGRVMPLDTFARRTLLTLSGKQTIAGISASEWLKGVLIHPTKHYNIPIFHVSNRALIRSLGLSPKKGNHFSFSEIASALSEKELSAEQHALIELTYKHSLFFDMSRSLSIFTPESQMSLDRTSQSLKVIPAPTNNPNMAWQSPWQITQSAIPSTSDQKAIMTAWQDLITSKDLAQSVKDIHDLTIDYTSVIKLKLEVFYHKLDPIKISLIFYLTSFLLAIMPFSKKKATILILQSFLLTGFWLHLAAISMRIIITERAPIATLYETIITTSFIAVLGFIYIYRKKPQIAGLLAGSSGAILHFLSFKFAYATDSFGVLVAVLNTNFWLSTHVTSMIIGYGFSFMASILGGWYLLERAQGKSEIECLPILNITISTMLFALLFSTLGTVLGGIWADQSWGRFWGWDPKENGALLLILWLSFLLHARFKTISSITFSAGSLITLVVLALAWFGVNLLGVGLHSYGFTNGIAWKLGLFCSLITGISILLWSIATRRNAQP